MGNTQSFNTSLDGCGMLLPKHGKPYINTKLRKEKRKDNTDTKSFNGSGMPSLLFSRPFMSAKKRRRSTNTHCSNGYGMQSLKSSQPGKSITSRNKRTNIHCSKSSSMECKKVFGLDSSKVRRLLPLSMKP